MLSESKDQIKQDIVSTKVESQIIPYTVFPKEIVHVHVQNLMQISQVVSVFCRGCWVGEEGDTNWSYTQDLEEQVWTKEAYLTYPTAKKTTLYKLTVVTRYIKARQWRRNIFYNQISIRMASRATNTE